VRSRVMLVGLGVAVAAGIVVGVADSSRLGLALAVAGAIAALTAAVVALRAVGDLARRVDRRFERVQSAQKRQLATGREALQLSRRTLQRVDRHREGLGAGLRKNAGQLAALEDRLRKELDALRRELRPTPTVVPFTGADLTTPGELAVSRLRLDGSERHVVLLLQTLAPRSIFAGIRTAVLAAAELATQLDLPLRILVFEDTGETRDDTLAGVQELLGEAGYPHLAERLRLSVEGARDDAHDPDDVWFATFWTTAWALGRLVDDGRIRAERVVHLVQDWEPGFYPWGDHFAKAESTYGRGFHTLVNSMPLATYVADQTGRTLDPASVFGPQVDTDALAAVAARWRPGPDGVVRVLFYARPGNPRNMFNLGLQSLRLWAEQLADGLRAQVSFAGAPVGAVDLGPAVDVELLGKTSYDDYYALLSRVDVGLALMNSPHPGHLALELPIAGIPTVTNLFGRYRTEWVDGLVLGDPTPTALASALDEALAQGKGLTAHQAHPELRGLGGSLTDAVAHVAGLIRA
jgi:hypothetical protein